MSGREAYALFCTERLSPQVLASILLGDAYAEGPEPRSRLFIVNNQTSIAHAREYPRTPPRSPLPSHAFFGWDAKRLADFLRDSDTKAFSLDYFFVADRQTADDQTLCLVTVKVGTPSVRLRVETIPFQLLHQGTWG